MKIKEQDSYHLVITPPLAQRVVVLLFLGAAILGVVILVVSVGGFLLFPILFIAVFLYIAGHIIGKKFVLDKLTENITLEKRHFMVVNKRRVIPFSAITSVTIEYKERRSQSGSYDTWRVSLDIGDERIWVDQKSKQEDIYHIANEIGRFIDKKVAVKSYGPHVDWTKHSPRP